MENRNTKHKGKKIVYALCVIALLVAAGTFVAYKYMPVIKGYVAGKVIESVFGNFGNIADVPDYDDSETAMQEYEKMNGKNNRYGINAKAAENGSSGSSLGMITVPDELAGQYSSVSGAELRHGGQQPLSVPANIDASTEKLQQLSEMMKNPLYQQFAREFSAAIIPELKGKNVSNPYELINVAMQSSKANAVAEKYSKNPEFIKLMEKLQQAAKDNADSPEAMADVVFPGLGDIMRSGIKQNIAAQNSGNTQPSEHKKVSVPSNFTLQQIEKDDDYDAADIFSIVSQGGGSTGAGKPVAIPQGSFGSRSASDANALEGVPFE